MKRFVLTLPVTLLACRAVVPVSSSAVSPTRNAGESCESPAECRSGACEDRVCCDRACGDIEACDLPRARGRCTVRDVGDRCGGAGNCLGGHCVDGLCCDGECTGTCMACDTAASPGRCAPVEANRADDTCAGTCAACFGGLCLPATAGTDPRGECDAGMACGVSGQCQVKPGGACAADAECATGGCIGGRCLRMTMGELNSPPLDTQVRPAWLLGVSLDALGRSSALLREVTPVAGGDADKTVYALQETDLGLRTHELARVVGCDQPQFVRPLGSVVAVGTATLLAWYDGADAYNEHCNGALQYHPGTVHAELRNALGQVSRADVIDDQGAVGPVRWMSASFDGSREVALAFVRLRTTAGTGTAVQLVRYDLGTGRWSASETLVDASIMDVPGQLLHLDGVATLLYADDLGVLGAVRAPRGGPPERDVIVVPDGVSQATALRRVSAARLATSAGDVAQLGFSCAWQNQERSGAAGSARYDPRAAPGSRFSDVTGLDAGLVGAAAVVAVSDDAAGYVVDGRFPHVVALRTQAADGTWRSTPLAPPHAALETVGSFSVVRSAGRFAVGWTLEKYATSSSATPTGSRVFRAVFSAD